ncbi:MAG: helicase, partial [Rhodobacterales bacterium]|nr:helicase [Rhodobacterales bacterium]
MDDEALFGPVIHELSFAQAIKNKLLTNYQVVVCGVDDARVRDAIDVGRMVETESGIQTDAATLAGHIAVARAMKRFGLRRTISFHSRVRKAKEFVNTLPKVCSWMGSEYAPEGEIVAGYVSGDMPVGRRNTKLNGLRQIGAGQHGLLANARCLSEGVDVPTLDGVAFIDPRRSQVDIVQAVGRAIRKADGKTLGTILIPVYLGDGEDADAMLAKSAFKPVWDVVRALRSHDVGLGEALDGYRVEIGRSGRMPAGLTGDRIILDIPERIGADFVGAFELQLVERSTSAFQFGLGVLRRFVEREGHAQVPKSWIEIVANGTHNLGMWCSTRRYDAKRGLLGKERLAALDSLGFDWDPYETGLQTGLAALQQFIEREGNADVPHGHVELSFGAPFKLGVWCSGRRSERKQGRLTDQRIAPLDGLQFVWDPYDAEFQYGLAALEQFVEREGNVRVRKSHIEVVGGEDFKLGSWCSTRRIERTHGRLTDERILSLDALGFEWDPMEALFQRGLLALQLFVEREGHARVPQSHVELVANEPFKLGSWCSTRRLGKKKGSLTDERIAAIDKLGFDWDPAETSFQEGIIALRQFIEREGHASVLQKHVEVVADSPFNLGRWFLTQRNGRKKGRQTIEHIAALDALGFDWDPIETVFQRAIAALRQFVEREGHTRVPLKHVEVVAEERLKLGIWCNGRRQDRKKGRLVDGQVAALDSVSFD